MPQGSRNLTWTCTTWNWTCYFLWCDWNCNFYSHSLPPSFRTCPPWVSPVHLAYFGTSQRIGRRREAQRRTELQDWRLLTPVQAYVEAPLAQSIQSSSAQFEGRGIISADPRIFMPLPQSSKSLSWYLLLQDQCLDVVVSRDAPHRPNFQYIH